MTHLDVLPDAPKPLAATVQQVSHRYGKVLALDDVTLDLPAGQMVGLIGPDGVGKSTLMALIAGAKKLQTGHVETLGGAMTSARHRADAGRRIAFMPQGLGRNLYHDLSIQENLDFFGKLFGLGKAERATRIARLTRATGLSTFMDRPAGKLSGGMKQKLGLCASLIHDPDFLLLDEPTTGVDPLSRRQFWDLIDTIRADRPEMSVLVSTAYMEEAARFGHLVAMEGGRILATGSPADLMERTGKPTVEAAYVALLGGDSAQEPAPEKPAPKAEIETGPPAIRAEGLTKRFGDFTAVDSVSFEIARGEIFGFLGSNGCGKTTTMKMLTGLTEATEGEAWIFGQPVDAQNLDTRHRVGFMSQSFSLYGELSVRENLLLHARLYHLGRTLTAQRLAELVPRFGLEPYLDQGAASLPLGVRQRLSLAVAVLHGPDILILDEPTSGVDPQARDMFWDMLLELAHRDGVTIFISTHFMDEGMRCDRISLMHAGKVLVSDAPKALIAKRGVETLEDAFIAYMLDASAADAPMEEGMLTSADAPEADTGAPRFSLQRLLAYTSREAMQVRRDPVRLVFSFVGSALLLLIMSFGISQEVRNIPFAAFDQDRSPESRAYLSGFEDSAWFLQAPPISDAVELERRMESGELALALQLPPGFGKSLRRGETSEIAGLIDGSDTNRAGTVESYVKGAHAHVLSEGAQSALALADLATPRTPNAAPPAQLIPRFHYNPAMESLPAIGPSIPPLLLLLFPAILMAVSVAREKEIGTITNFYVTPTSRAEFLIGKQLVYIGITLLNFVILTALVVTVLGVPLKGDPMTLVLGALLYAVAATGYGLVVSMLTKTQVTAVFAAAILSVMPTLQFSGMMTPVSSLEGAAQIMGTFWPTTWYMGISVGTFTKGLGLSELAGHLLRLAAFGPILTLLAVLALRKQER
ncbi:ribosome-associated ATPase/putative transporter RbbA [Litoreibacter arenae]|uniref:ABC-type multidrug transport system, permease component n=1 Tax=Litoreibacter arenae DSM 19593 TaxID=1123360 RepID=S9Q8P0_9RHOB|nr:ribosome-associated ATPase/putative transporter RbbA [Litoreibacter arenae]EPX77741.1 ABC-type multidrug transport system, permease component [Litoreibacter arenae DSM 19593]